MKLSIKWLGPGLALGAGVVAAGLYAWHPAFFGRLLGASDPAEILVSGNIEAHQSVLAFKTIQARITDLPFDEGQWVKAGSMMAQVDDADYRQQVAIAQAALVVQQRQLDSAEQALLATRQTLLADEADLAQKRSDAERIQVLWRRGDAATQQRDQTATAVKQSSAMHDRDAALVAASERNVDLVKANIHSAEEALKMARIVLGYTQLTAPYDGILLVRQAELGEIAQPGTPIVTLADLDHVWLRAYINETDLGKVRLGETVTVTNDSYPDKSYAGRVSFIAANAEFTPKSVETHAERVTLVYRVRIDIDNPTHELLPGMPADAMLRVLPPGP